MLLTCGFGFPILLGHCLAKCPGFPQLKQVSFFMQSSLTWLLMKGFPWAAGLLVVALPLLQEGLKFAGVGWGAVCITRGFWADGSYGAFLASYFLLRSSYIALSSMIDLYSRSAMRALLTRVWKSGKSNMLS